MNPEVKAKAEALAEALVASEEYKALSEAQEELEKHEAAKIMLRDFRQKQLLLQQKIVAGQTPTESEVQQLQEAYHLVAFNPYVRKVLEAEAAFAAMLAEVQRILGEAIGAEAGEEGLGDQPGAAGGASTIERSDDRGSARSRLWVPGR